MANNKRRSQSRHEVNPHETLESIGEGIKSEAKRSASTAAEQLGITALWKKILGGEDSSIASEEHVQTEANPLEPGVIYTAHQADKQQEISAKIRHFRKPQLEQHHYERQRQQQEVKRKPEARAAINYHEQFTDAIMHFDRKAKDRQNHEMNQQIQEILVELKKLIGSSKELKVQFAQVAVEHGPVEAGAYHVSFFEWMLIVIKQARQKVEDAGAWLQTVKGKGAKKSGYWDMFKKHGTSFAMSNERQVATSVG